jgi:hypothetical protein
LFLKKEKSEKVKGQRLIKILLSLYLSNLKKLISFLSKSAVFAMPCELAFSSSTPAAVDWVISFIP